MTTINELVERALTDAEPADAVQFIQAARESLGKCIDTVSSTIRDLLLLAAAFELIARASISKASIGGLEITDLSLILKAAPAVIAFLAYRLAASLVWSRTLAQYHSAIIGRVYPKLHASDFDLILPPGPFVAEGFLSNHTTGPRKWFATHAALPQMISLVAGPFLFLVYAYWRCFCAFGFTDPILWASVVVSSVLCIQAIALYIGLGETIPD